MVKQGIGIGMLVAGFLLGTIGVKAATSKPAKKLYVQGVSKVLQAKNAGLDILEEAKSNLDDIIAEANYLNREDAAEAASPNATSPGVASSSAASPDVA
ncbi:MAG: DUF6110 family protein [Coriobacteriales bacterium]|jgi:hypothetical protein|nr:DUF6110 family protein [Coriobacteriales bacterium]